MMLSSIRKFPYYRVGLPKGQRALGKTLLVFVLEIKTMALLWPTCADLTF